MRIGLTVLTIILATPARGGIEHTILHGASVAAVRATSGPDTIPGMTSEALQAVAESRLRTAAVPFDPKASAVLWVNATVVLGESGTCFVRLEGQLVEEARLARNGFLVTANSWSSGGVVAVRASDCASRVRETEESLVADFVEHYRAMNPRTPTAQ